MSSEEESDDEFGLPSDAEEYAAMNSEYTVSEVRDILAELQVALENNLVKFYERSWMRRAFWHLFEYDNRSSVWFALSVHTLREHTRDTDLSQQDLEVAVMAHQYFAREMMEFAVNTRPKNLKDHYPIYIRKPPEWSDAEHVVDLNFYRLFRFNLSPTEVLDYWLCDLRGWDKHQVAGWRDVDVEAVRKNLRQAREKIDLDEPETDWFYHEDQIVTVPMHELDESAHLENPPIDSRLQSLDDVDDEEE